MSFERFERRRPSGGGGEPPAPRGRIIPFPNADWRSLRRYWLLLGAIVGVMGLAYLALDALEVPLFEDPSRGIAAAGPLSGAVVFGLLVGDILLPVPSSLVMFASGAFFGPVPGALLSMAGGVSASAIAFALGRHGSPLLVRLVGPVERLTSDRLLERHGALAVLVTRPVPILAEATALLAGASPLSWPKAMTAAAIGMLPSAVIYAAAGSFASGLPGLPVIFMIVIVLGVAFAAAERLYSARGPASRRDDAR